MYNNKYKKKEIEKKKDIGLLVILRKIESCKYSDEVANILNTVINSMGIESAKKVFLKAIKNRPDLPLPYFKIDEGVFTGYKVNTRIFVDTFDFFENPDYFMNIHKKYKEKSLSRHRELEEKIKLKNDFLYRYKYLDNYLIPFDSANKFPFFNFLFKENFVKIVRDNPLISSVPDEKKIYAVLPAFFQNEPYSLSKYDFFEKETSLFPSPLGYSFLGDKNAPECYIVNNLSEIEEYFEKENFSEMFLKSFFKKSKFVILNDMDLSIRIFPQKEILVKKIAGDEMLLDYVGNSNIKTDMLRDKEKIAGLNVFLKQNINRKKNKEKIIEF